MGFARPVGAGLVTTLLVACTPAGPGVRSPPDPTSTGTPPTRPQPTPTEVPTLSTPAALAGVPRVVRLPFVEVGDDAPEAELVVTGDGSLDVAIAVGPFELVGDWVDGDAGRSATVRLTGGTADARLAPGEATVTLDGVAFDVVLSAVVGDPTLPAVSLTSDDWGERGVFALPSAPFVPSGPGPWYDDSVLVALPRGFSGIGGVATVTHLHGFGATLLDTAAYQYLVEQHTLSGRDAVLIVPQGPLEASSGDFGQLDDPGGHERLVRDVISVLYREGRVDDVSPGGVVVTAHSGGYDATADLLEAGGLPVDVVHLFDALYARESTFEDFALDGGLLRSVYTPYGGTVDNNSLLSGWLDGALPVTDELDDDALQAFDVAIGPSDAPHDDVVSDRRAFARWLAQSGLPPTAAAPPDLLGVVSDGDVVRVTWRLDVSAPDRPVVVEGSDDGVVFTELGRGPSGVVSVAPAPFVRVVAETAGVRSEPSDVYGATGTRFLIVDGFDRLFGGSYASPTHAFAARVGAALPPGGYSAVSSEGLVAGLADPADYDAVLWLLGDESLADDTFDSLERAAAEAIVAAGVPLVVSGAEVGFATDPTWLSAELGATYVSDDAGTDVAGGFQFGVAYPEDYPDVLGGGPAVWTYDTGGAAAVQTFAGIVVGFPLETLRDDDLAPALAELVDAL